VRPARIGGDRLLRGREQLRIAGERVGAEEDVVRLLRRPREGAHEAVDEDHDPAVRDRKCVAPEPERMPQPEMRREKRVRLLPR
jgi:hypothetical protein